MKNITSDSGRTKVSVELDETGKGLITVDRDGRRVTHLDIAAEPMAVDEVPRSGAVA
jgi:hypothetical protein